MTIQHKINLPYDGLIALLQGKDLHLIKGSIDEKENIEIIISPPFDGVFLTHKQIDELRSESINGLYKLLTSIQREKVIEMKD